MYNTNKTLIGKRRDFIKCPNTTTTKETKRGKN